MASGVKDLKVWQEAVLLGGEVVRCMRQATRREIKAFTDHVMQDAVGVAACIADGYHHYTNAEQRPFFAQARRMLGNVETQLAIARQAGLITPAAHANLGVRISSVSRLLTGYLSYLDRQIAVEREANIGNRSLTPVGAFVPGATSATQLADRVG